MCMCCQDPLLPLLSDALSPLELDCLLDPDSACEDPKRATASLAGCDSLPSDVAGAWDVPPDSRLVSLLEL